jgi:hypothetical protein
VRVVARASFASRQRVIAIATGAVVAGVLLAGCAPQGGPPVPTATPVETAEPAPTPTPDPELVEGGTAGQNRPYFEFTLRTLLDETPQPSTQALVAALVAAGFDRAAMQATADTTPTGARADSVLVSVRIEDQCLIGQTANGGLVTELADVLGSGACLVGRTASLD